MIQLKPGIPPATLKKPRRIRPSAEQTRPTKRKSPVCVSSASSATRDQAVRSSRMGAAHRRNHRRRRQGHFQTGKRRSAEKLAALATKVVVSKYFYGDMRTAPTHTSRTRNFRAPTHPSRHPHDCRLGHQGRLFRKASGEVFYDELTWLCLNQYGAFNSPVWFNVGLVSSVRRRQKSGARQLVLQPQDRRGRARAAPNTNIRRAAPASSSRSRTTWKTSCTWPTARRCSSSTAPAPAPIFRPSVPARKSSAAAAGPAVRCRS